MANRTDPLISQVSGSDPQNLMEYLIRQRIYDSRYWKETCFGLTVQDVMEESTNTTAKSSSLSRPGTDYNDHDNDIRGGPVAIGHLQFLALVLKLLQLHPETDLIVETFVEQDEFKYTRALGALYVRLTGRPADIYVALEALYSDRRKVRCLSTTITSATATTYSIQYMDDYVHQLLTESTVAGIVLPRLPQRRGLQEAGYLPTIITKDHHDDDNKSDGIPLSRPTSLKEMLQQHGGPLAYLKYKALVEQCPAALSAWNEKYAKYDDENNRDKNQDPIKVRDPKSQTTTTTTLQHNHSSRNKKAKLEQKLFKTTTKKQPAHSSSTTMVGDDRTSDEYWNQERTKLGLAPLK
ncbi:hypothetical protein ACA910_009753 [Epithemia clementina (nom. ined.)]